MDRLRGIGRVLIFLVAVGGAAAIVVGALGLGGLNGELSLCSLGSPEDLYLESYIQMNAEALERPAGEDDTPVTFVVQPGETAADIALRLQEVGLVSDAELFRRYLQVEGLDAGLEAGTYTLRQTMTIPEIAVALQSGQQPEQQVTIREGLRLEEIAAAVAAQTGIAEDAFLDLATTGWREAGFDRYAFLASAPPEVSLEGFLFPETYRLAMEATAYDLLARMLDTFDQRVTEAIRQAAVDGGLTAYQMVTLASIVEREAAVAAERPVIAGVYFNRLEAGWLLNADPTVQYGLGFDPESGEWWPDLYFDALGITSLAEIDHPYNTYRIVGLPPGPICSPGLASIEAVAYPETTDYFFFMADCHVGDGSHLFAATEAEHFANYASCGGTPP